MQLSSKRLVFNKVKFNDLENYLSLVTSKKVMQFITGEPISKEKGILKFEQLLAENQTKTKYGHFLVFQKTNDQFVGYAKLVETSTDIAELGYLFLSEFWGKGFGNEVSEILTKYSKTIAELKKVIAIIDPENEASKKILLNCGFHLHKTCIMDGLPAAIYHLEL